MLEDTAVEITVTDELTDDVVDACRHVLVAALPEDKRDDRFADTWIREARGADAGFVAALATIGNDTLGLLVGSHDDHVVAVDSLMAATVTDPQQVLHRLLDRLQAWADTNLADSPNQSDSPSLELWAKPAFGFHEHVAAARGLDAHRALHQLRSSLPVDAPGLPTRSFEPDRDEELLLNLNNRAFSGHPDQGGLTLAEIKRRLARPWVRPEGIRIYEQNGTPAGFCWTKIHDGPEIGEIYVIGVDPDFHGQGLGVPMTASGLHWLAEQGLRTAMLYVEADNEPALRTYARLGFEVARTDRAWRGPIS